MFRDSSYTCCPYKSIVSPIINIPYQGVTFVIIDEPAMTHHNHSVIVYIRVHAWCCTSSEFGQMYNDMYLPLQYCTEQFHCPKNLPCFACLSLPSHQPLATTDLFTTFIVLPFPECHIVGIIKYVAFSDQLLLLSNMHLCSLRIFSCPDSAFLFSAEYYSIDWMYHS